MIHRFGRKKRISRKDAKYAKLKKLF